MTYRIACIGEPLAELSNGPDGLGTAFGGDTLNTAIYCARAVAGQDIAVSYVTAIGEDAASTAALDLMRAEGLNVDFVRQDPDRQIGIYAIQNDEHGERHFHYWRDASAARQLFATDNSPEAQAIAQADLIYLSGITLAILSPAARDRLFAALCARRKAGGVFAFDSNMRPALWENANTAKSQTQRYWQITDIALPTLEDEAALFGDATPRDVVTRLQSLGITDGAVKHGASGPVALNEGCEALMFEPAARVIDTTGAGDSFNGAYLAGIAQNLPDAENLMTAHRLAAQVVGHKGAILPRDPAPTVRRIGSVIRLHPEHYAEYTRLHAEVWPGVLARLKASNFRNYSIFLKRPEHLMFGYFEYTGTDFAADNAAIAADPTTQDWWKVCGPMQDPFETRKDEEWWAEMEQVFYLE
ncbi:PfkB family carbohydrate kinase [uncultured Ruegeria sp.]|uniref:PfkB family carbohydrate kinase n=1 Tax=uncultured Ruegeria sp. TaxID=259304 RepID=UPI002636E8AA|nr:PfkB family carbohydrate kinase [uncultured Ruegeria sp.]